MVSKSLFVKDEKNVRNKKITFLRASIELTKWAFPFAPAFSDDFWQCYIKRYVAPRLTPKNREKNMYCNIYNGFVLVSFDFVT